MVQQKLLSLRKMTKNETYLIGSVAQFDPSALSILIASELDVARGGCAHAEGAPARRRRSKGLRARVVHVIGVRVEATLLARAAHLATRRRDVQSEGEDRSSQMRWVLHALRKILTLYL